ncbi:hypothetical protein Y032_0020g125 [Ancylostoma ceylanicum]|uniref:Sodium:neurotransmitter symporter family protein n=1 Tax=Ancylostoma ceylanicum TaxID=53326 RepID=A0A016UZP9_9BILA|nr:hypothetical protein Y032_0020g125 [Ancylostoma ceylanicum]
MARPDSKEPVQTVEESASSESEESESISLKKDEQIYDEELMVTLGKLTRNLMFRPMWKNRTTAFFVISGYIITYSTGARMAHHFDRYGILFCVPLSLCMFFIGIPLVYLEMSLGQFTSLNAIVVFKRMAPLFSGVGVSMTLLSIIVTITDHLALYNFVAIVGNTIQMNLNEMPWHRCNNFFDSEDCKSRTSCKQDIQLDFYKLDKTLLYERGLDSLEPREFIGECIVSESPKLYHRNYDPHQKAHYSIFKRTGSEISYLSNKIGVKSIGNLDFEYPSPSHFLALFCCLALLVFVSMQGRGFVVKSCLITAVLSFVVLLGFIIAVTTTPTRQYHSWLWSKISLFYPPMWATSLLLTLNVLRIGQGGLYFLGAQNKFINNAFVDAFIVVIFVMGFLLVSTYVHILTVSGGGLRVAGYVVEKFGEYYEQKRDENVYYQLFYFWTTIANLAAYGAYEPYIQCAFSFLCAMLSINSTFLWLEMFVSTCVNTFHSLSDHASQVTIHRTVIIFLSLPFLLVRNRLGFHTLVAVENTVIPAISAIIVIIELLVVGGVYGFRRLWSNISCMSSDSDDETIIHRTSGLGFMVVWVVTPLLLLISLYIAYPHSHEDASMSVALISALILVPIPVMAVLKLVDKVCCGGRVAASHWSAATVTALCFSYVLIGFSAGFMFHQPKGDVLLSENDILNSLSAVARDCLLVVLLVLT